MQESHAQWSGFLTNGMPGVKRGGNRNAQGATDSLPNSQNSHMISSSPKANLLTYEQMETHLSQLEIGLKLTSDQNKAWDSFASKARLYAADIDKERARLNAESGAPPDGLTYLNQASENAKSRYTTLKEVDEAAKPLYKLLNSDQKTIFDNKLPTFINATPQQLRLHQPNYNLPDMDANPSSAHSDSNPTSGVTHQ